MAGVVAKRAMFERMGFTNTAATLLTDEQGIDALLEVRNLEDANTENLCNLYTWYPLAQHREEHPLCIRGILQGLHPLNEEWSQVNVQKFLAQSVKNNTEVVVIAID